MAKSGARVLNAKQALQRLREGNDRFASNSPTSAGRPTQAKRAELAKGQNPFAIILGCADSRVPAEIVFDQGIGDLFVTRVAGNVAAPSQIGSVEFGATHFGVRLVVVLGHSRCGAVLATLEELQRESANHSDALRAILDLVRPSFDGLFDTDLKHDPEALVQHAVRANIHHSGDQLRHGSPILEQLIRDEGLVVVGAEYSLETGVVEFLNPESLPPAV